MINRTHLSNYYERESCNVDAIEEAMQVMGSRNLFSKNNTKLGYDMCRKRLYCIGVKPIYTESPANVWQRELYPMPSICYCDFGHEITTLIVTLKELAMDNCLAEVSKQTTLVTWFFEQVNSYHVDIPSFIHVSASHVYFSGAVLPYKQVYFQTHKVPLHEILENESEFQTIDLARLSLPLAKGLMSKLTVRSEDLERLNDRYYALDDVLTALVKVDDETSESLNSISSDYSISLSSEIAELQKQCSSLELEIEELCKKLLYRVFSLSIGDWIYSYSRKRTQLKIKNVSFIDNSIMLSGPIITQKGEVGKREDTIYINLLTKDEH